MTLKDLYLIVGEREVLRCLQQRQIDALQQEIAELRAQIAALRG